MSKKSLISRRNFLIAGAAAAAGCATQRAPIAVPVTTGPAAEAVNVGFIGCGARGQALASALVAKTNPPARITAVYDACAGRGGKLAQMTKAASCRNWQNLIERKEVTAVVVATPDHLHAPITIAAMEAGKDVYCERPMALGLEDAKKVRDTAARTGRILQIGAQQTSEAQWHEAKRMLDAGKLGKIRWSQGRYTNTTADINAAIDASEQPDWQAFSPVGSRAADPERFYHWRKYQDYSGGVAWSDLYWKLAALLVALPVEWPIRVSAAGGIYAKDGREVPDSFVMNAEFPSGHTVVLASAMAGKVDRPAVIRGETAAIEFNGNSINFINDGGYGESKAVAVEARADHLDNWLTGIRTRQKCVCDESLGYRTSAIIATAMQAYASGKSLAFDGATEATIPAPGRA